MLVQNMTGINLYISFTETKFLYFLYQIRIGICYCFIRT